jgi:hypothetical protein
MQLRTLPFVCISLLLPVLANLGAAFSWSGDPFEVTDQEAQQMCLTAECTVEFIGGGYSGHFLGGRIHARYEITDGHGTRVAGVRAQKSLHLLPWKVEAFSMVPAQANQSSSADGIIPWVGGQRS